ncbi:aldehyde dehydrogenase family protein [bacterium]|nr:aldehyde dehydrogenase family protein [bacterium]
MSMDKDLGALQEVRDRLKAAREARFVMEKASQADADRWASAAAAAGRKEAARLARMAVEETDIGVVAGKTLKNIFATEITWEKIKDMKTAGVIRRDERAGVVEIAHPAGVVAAVIPTTNPTSTALFKCLIALKARCSIVVSPHPRAVKCIAESCRVMHDAARAAGAPEGCICWLENVTIESTNALMRHRWTSIILATGGPGLVDAAYSSGKPAIGVGSGNVPAYIHESADISHACRAIVLGQVFDNGTICSSEQSIVCDKAVERQVLEELKKRGCHVCSPEEIKKLEPVVKKGDRQNPDIVGKYPRVIAKMAGFSVPDDTTVLICPYEKVGPDAPLSLEKLSPVLTFYTVDGWREAREKCIEILRYGGLGHSASIHAKDEKTIMEFAEAMPAMRLMVNSPTTQGAIGYTTNLFPSMTLGCGTPGGNIFSDNIGPQHLINTKRLAYVNEAMLDQDESREHELRAELGDTRLPWSPGKSGAVERRPQAGAAPEPRRVAVGAGIEGASPLSPADIDAILSKHKK